MLNVTAIVKMIRLEYKCLEIEKKISQILWTLRKLHVHFNIIKEWIIVDFGNLISES